MIFTILLTLGIGIGIYLSARKIKGYLKKKICKPPEREIPESKGKLVARLSYWKKRAKEKGKEEEKEKELARMIEKKRREIRRAVRRSYMFVPKRKIISLR